MGLLDEQMWWISDNPRHLLRLSRMRPNGRKYLLLACAVVRHLFPGSRTDGAAQILDAAERFAVAQPRKGVQTHVWREVIRPAVPHLPDLIPRGWTRDPDGWIGVFAQRLGPLSQVRPADINVLLELALRKTERQAGRDAVTEVSQLTARLTVPAVYPPLTLEEFRDEIVSRFAPERREAARASWAGVTDNRTAHQLANGLVTELYRQRMTEVNVRACELVREVFANPFRAASFDPVWTACNHGAAKHIAEQIVASGNFSDMPILADALEDAGCRDEELLRHCREERTHVPGCWALDVVLGRN